MYTGEYSHPGHLLCLLHYIKQTTEDLPVIHITLLVKLSLISKIKDCALVYLNSTYTDRICNDWGWRNNLMGPIQNGYVWCSDPGNTFRKYIQELNRCESDEDVLVWVEICYYVLTWQLFSMQQKEKELYKRTTVLSLVWIETVTVRNKFTERAIKE